MKKDFDTGLRKGIEADRVKLTRRRKLLLREMGLAEDLDSTELAEKLHAQTLVVNVLNRNLVRRDEEIEKLKARIAELEGRAKPVAKTSANSSVPPSRNPIGSSHAIPTEALRPEDRRAEVASGRHAAAVRGCDRDGTLVSRGRLSRVRQTAGHGIRDNRRHEAGGGHSASDHGGGDGASPDAGEVLLRPLLQGQVPRERERPGILRTQHHGLASYLSTYQNVPFMRLTHLFETIFGLHVSEGTVSNMLNTMKRISKKPYEMIRRKVAAGKVAGAEPRGCTSRSSTWRPATAARTSASRRRRTAA